MRKISLSSSLGTGAMELLLRVPGAAVCKRIAGLVDSEGRLPCDAVSKIASRLSGVAEGRIARLSLSDRTAIRQAIEGLFMIETRRQRARKRVT